MELRESAIAFDRMMSEFFSGKNPKDPLVTQYVVDSGNAVITRAVAGWRLIRMALEKDTSPVI